MMIFIKSLGQTERAQKRSIDFRPYTKNTLCEVYNMPLLRENDSLMSLNLALSQISIPEIYGEYLDWPRFHDLFLELVHNKTYSASQRLHILQGSIRGEE
ncbi:uncharacterized protein LOC122818584 isoform X5 [Drosophila biarmipes]|uniref:uncharacterized protein LOC122818584 isoform X4 n=1 Tax=Drosophila biarmipes TaxID=125945 RepID=UPI001CDB3756|nr:uncharacterized protein LOC122818584 isoform X4 [Drosophila biarmipes]XP_043948718.1 uncharacterized protein LOC122818586 isoform X2 [Drosophila biarmipes]XP_043948720.1 uncharacterized protein LOC122818587 isoform X2 [Drosophila biarmipes]XP_043948722.1 uncharacterized protein LOC122818584 isoform X3 [Drosophila biarmipes]XP_050745935.1 uncharacterized protein LOC122818584 isoform X5 [Drosophila biarmipes]